VRWRAAGDAGLIAPWAFSFFHSMKNHRHEAEPRKTRRGRPPGAVQLLTVQEVAERLRVPLKTVYWWTAQVCELDGEPLLAVVRLGGRVRVSEAALAALPGRLAHRAPAAFSFFSDAAGGVKP